MRADIADLFSDDELTTFEFVAALAGADAYFDKRRQVARFVVVPLMVIKPYPQHLSIAAPIA